MKKKLLLLLPIIPLAVSCGEADPMAEVAKSLPSDVQVVPVQSEEEKEAYTEIVDTAFENFLNPDDLTQYHELDIDVRFNVAGEGFSGSGSIKGEISLGIAKEYNEQTEKNYCSAFIAVKGLSVTENVNLPKEVTIPIPSSMSFTDVDVSLLVTEMTTGVYAFLDGSDHEFQDLVHFVLASTGMPEEDVVNPEVPGEVTYGVQTYLDMFLGEKEEGEQYRPGHALINVRDLLNSIGNYLEDPAPEEIVNAPVTYLSQMMVAQFVNWNDLILGYVDKALEMINPTVGVKVEDELVVKTSVLLNVSTYSLAAQAGIDESTFPIHGYAGLLVSVGTENGSSIPCIEEVKLSANLNGAVEGVSFSVVGSVGLESYYEEQAEEKFIEIDPEVENIDITALTFEFIKMFLETRQ